MTENDSGWCIVSRQSSAEAAHIRNRTYEPQNMETVLVFRDLGWQYAVGVATLLVGAVLFYFFDPRETDEERTRRQKRDAERARSGSAKTADNPQEESAPAA